MMYDSVRRGWQNPAYYAPEQSLEKTRAHSYGTLLILYQLSFSIPAHAHLSHLERDSRMSHTAYADVHVA